MTIINEGTFSGSGLTSVFIPNSVTDIGNYAFSGCSGLISVIIGRGVAKIGDRAFSNCVELMNMYCYPDKRPNASYYTFEGSYIEYATLHVPKSCIGDYKANPWRDFKSVVRLPQ